MKQILLSLLLGVCLLLLCITAEADPLPEDFRGFLEERDLLSGSPGAGWADPAVVSDWLLRLIEEANTVSNYLPPEERKHPSVFLFDGKALRVNSDGSEQILVRKTIKLLKDPPGQTCEMKIPYNSAVETVELVFARTITANDNYMRRVKK